MVYNKILNVNNKLNIVGSSVVDMKVDAIVNAANTSLLGGGGVDGAIHKKAGPKLLEECRTLNGCESGNAKITKAYNIKNAKYIIHTVGPIYSGSQEDSYLLSMCYKNSLDLAKKYKLKSIAFPGISTGVYGYPIEEASKIAIESVVNWFDNNENYDIKVYFACFRDIELETYKRLMNI